MQRKTETQKRADSVLRFAFYVFRFYGRCRRLLGPRHARAQVSAPAATEWFTDKAKETGLDFVHFNGMSGEFYYPEIMPPGVALFDYDNDGDLDVFVVQGQMLGSKPLASAKPQPRGPLPLTGRLFRNDLQVAADGTRTLHFTDVTEASGIVTPRIRDGRRDRRLQQRRLRRSLRHVARPESAVSQQLRRHLHRRVEGQPDRRRRVEHFGVVCRLRSRRLARSVRRPLPELQPSRPTSSASACRAASTTARRTCTGRIRATCITTTATARSPTSPWRPACRASLARRSACRRPTSTATAGSTSTWPTTASRISSGSISTTAPSRTRRCCRAPRLSPEGEAKSSMGVDAGDFDNDGDEDLFITELTGQGDDLYVNDGSGTFEDRSARAGIRLPSLPFTGFGAGWFDFDNDGWLDVLTVNGAVIAERRSAGAERAVLAAAAQAAVQESRQRTIRGRDEAGRRGLRDSRSEPRPGVRRHRQRRRRRRRRRQRQRPVAAADQQHRQPEALGGIAACAALPAAAGCATWSAHASRSDAATVSRSGGGRVPMAVTRRPAIRACWSGSATRTRRSTVRVIWPDGRTEEWKSVPIDRYTTLKEGDAPLTERSLVVLCMVLAAWRLLVAGSRDATCFGRRATKSRAARSVSCIPVGAGPASRRLRGVDAQHRDRRDQTCRSRRRVRQDGHAADGCRVPRRGGVRVSQRGGPVTERRPLALLPRAPVQDQRRHAKVGGGLRTGARAAARRCADAGVAGRRCSRSGQARGGAAVVCQGAVAAAAARRGAVRTGTRGARQTGLRAGCGLSRAGTDARSQSDHRPLSAGAGLSRAGRRRPKPKRICGSAAPCRSSRTTR